MASMTKLHVCCAFVCFVSASFLSAEHIAEEPKPVWSWIGGSGEGEARDTFYNDSFAYPGSRRGAASWDDGNGHMLMFGGDDKDSNLWSYDVDYNSWSIIQTEVRVGEHPGHQRFAVMCGSKADGRVVLVGGVDRSGIEIGRLWLLDMADSGWSEIADFNETLLRRWMFQNWCDSDGGVLYLFGGYAKSRANVHAHYPDGMWKFDIATAQFEEIVLNGSTPAPRYGGATWLDAYSGYLWLLGGMNRQGRLNDLWRFDIRNNVWEEIHSSNEQAGLYGELGVGSLRSHPGSRTGAFTWVDECGNLWLFAGEGHGAPSRQAFRFEDDGLLNDLWMYLKQQSMWVWMGGTQEVEGTGTYGDLMASSTDFLPGPRTHGVAWSVNNTAFVFGGNGHNMYGSDADMNDLWRLDMSGQCDWTVGSSRGGSHVDINPGTTVPEPASQDVQSTETPSEHKVVSSVSVSGVGVSTESASVATTHQPKSVSIETKQRLTISETNEAATASSVVEVSPSEQLVAKATSHTGSESTVRFDSEPSTQAVGQSATEIPSELATEGESISSSQSASEPITHHPNRPHIQSGGNFFGETSNTPITHNLTNPTSRPGEEVLLQPNWSSKTTSESTTQTPSEASTNPGFETTSQTSNTNTERGQPTTQAKDAFLSTQSEGMQPAIIQIGSESNHKELNALEATKGRILEASTSQATAMTTTHSATKTATETESKHADVGITRPPLSEETEPVGVQATIKITARQKSTDRIISELVTTEGNMGEESTIGTTMEGLTSQSMPAATTHSSTTRITEAEGRHSSPAGDFEITGSTLSQQTEPVGLQTEPAIKITRKSNDQIASEPLATETATQRRPFVVPLLPDESHVWNNMKPEKPSVLDVPQLPDESHMGEGISHSSSSTGWFGSRKAAPYITAALVVFAVVLFVVGVLIGRPCCKQKRRRQRYDYQKVASDDVTEWQ